MNIIKYDILSTTTVMPSINRNTY